MRRSWSTHRIVSILGIAYAVLLSAYAMLSHWSDAGRAWGPLYPVVLGLSTVLFGAALWTIARAQDVDASTESLVRNFAILFAVLLTAATPVLLNDFWLVAAWGRQILAGGNPYLALPAGIFLEGLPLTGVDAGVRYGPLWALTSAGVMAVSQGDLLAWTVLRRALQLAAFLGCIGAIGSILQKTAPRERALALVLFAWLPLSLIHGVAEGHDQMIVAALVLGWVAALSHRRRVVGTLLLTASALVGPVTAPLLILDLLWYVRHRRVPLRDWLGTALPSLGLAVLVFAPFLGGFLRFSEASFPVRQGLLAPAAALGAALRLVGLDAIAWLGAGAGFVVFGLFLLLPLAYGATWLLRPTARGFHEVALAGLLGMVFVLTDHAWSWVLICPIAFAALSPRSLLTRFTVAIAVTSPLALYFAVARPSGVWTWDIEVPGLLMYVGALGLVGVLTWVLQVRSHAPVSRHAWPQPDVAAIPWFDGIEPLRRLKRDEVTLPGPVEGAPRWAGAAPRRDPVPPVPRARSASPQEVLAPSEAPPSRPSSSSPDRRRSP